MSVSRGATTLHIRAIQWTQIQDLLNHDENVIISSISAPNQLQFIQRAIFQKENKFDDANKFWIHQYTLHLATSLNLTQHTSIESLASTDIEDKIQQFIRAHRQAAILLIVDQSKLSKSKAKKNLEMITF